MSLNRVKLNLARMDGYPNGSADCGYDFVAPLDADGQIDPKQFEQFKSKCSVVRFWEGEHMEFGGLYKTDAGEWGFSYEEGDDDDEPFFHLAQHRLAVGEYLSIKEHDGITRPFRITSVDPISSE